MQSRAAFRRRRPRNGALIAAILILLLTKLDAAPLKQTLWFFAGASGPNPVTDVTARHALITNAAATGIADLYVSVYSSTPNAAGRYMYDETDIADLVSLAHTNGMQVFAAYGAPDWPTFGCNPNGFPLQRMAEVADYNSANPSAKFDGVILDIEPPEPQSTSAFQALLSQYDCIRSALPNDVRLAVAIRFFWDTLVQYPAGTGQTKAVYGHVIDMPMDHVVVMGYRDFAGPGDCATDGIVCLDKEEIGYAASIGKLSFVLAGLETIDPAGAGITNKETFFEEGVAIMNSEAQRVIDDFGHGSGFGGFAIHNYQASYLTGSTAWPLTNPSFPMN